MYSKVEAEQDAHAPKIRQTQARRCQIHKLKCDYLGLFSRRWVLLSGCRQAEHCQMLASLPCNKIIDADCSCMDLVNGNRSHSDCICACNSAEYISAALAVNCCQQVLFASELMLGLCASVRLCCYVEIISCKDFPILISKVEPS